MASGTMTGEDEYNKWTIDDVSDWLIKHDLLDFVSAFKGAYNSLLERLL